MQEDAYSGRTYSVFVRYHVVFVSSYYSVYCYEIQNLRHRRERLAVAVASQSYSTNYSPSHTLYRACVVSGSLYRKSEDATTQASTVLPKPGGTGSLSENEVRWPLIFSYIERPDVLRNTAFFQRGYGVGVSENAGVGGDNLINSFITAPTCFWGNYLELLGVVFAVDKRVLRPRGGHGLRRIQYRA